MKKLDLSLELCPIPVIKTKKYIENIENKEDFIVILGNIEAKENVKRYLDDNKINYDITEHDNLINIHIFLRAFRGLNTNMSVLKDEKNITKNNILNEENTIIVISSDTMGTGDEILGRKLLNAFLYSLTELEIKPYKIIFYNSGVKVITSDAEAQDNLLKLQKSGVLIESCGLCLNYYNLSDKLNIGIVTNMYSIASDLLSKETKIVKVC